MTVSVLKKRSKSRSSVLSENCPMHKGHFDWRKFIQPRDECFLLLCFFGGFYFYYLSIVCLSNNHSLVRLLHGKGAYPENLYCFLSWTCHMTLKKCRRQWHYVDHRVPLYKIYLLLLWSTFGTVLFKLVMETSCGIMFCSRSAWLRIHCLTHTQQQQQQNMSKPLTTS